MITGSNPVAVGGDELVAAALSLFSGAFSSLEKSGAIVREFPEKRDTNIWVFGYLLEAVASAHVAPVYERRRFDHAAMLSEMASSLEWQGHAQAADVVRARAATSIFPKVPDDDKERYFRLGNMRRFLNFAMGLALEMKDNGIWPEHDGLEPYRSAYESATRPGSTPSFVLDVRDLVDDIAREVATVSDDGAVAVLRFRNWKRRLC